MKHIKLHLMHIVQYLLIKEVRDLSCVFKNGKIKLPILKNI